MLGYDLQISTVTGRLMADHCEQGNIHWAAQKAKFYPSCTINHVLTRIFGALHHKPEGYGLDSRWSYWKFQLVKYLRPQYDLV